MRILIVHNQYLQAGGEDAVVEAERNLLATRHDVELLFFTNATTSTFKMAVGLFDNEEANKRISQAILRFKPAIVHVHNVWYNIGLGVFRTIKSHNVKLVHTLHNYRNVCLNGMLNLKGETCLRCLDVPIALPGIQNKCNKDSYASSAVVAGSLAYHRLQESFRLADKVICLTAFQRDLMLKANLGYTEEQLVVKPNFYVAAPFVPQTREPFILFVGRLTQEKGAQFLPELAKAGIPLRVVGSGPLEEQMQGVDGLTYLGWQSESAIDVLMQQAKALILPSIWHEGLPMVLVKAFAAGLPVLTSNNENLSQLVTSGFNGLCVAPTTETLLHGTHLLLNDPNWQLMSNNARQTYLDEYTAERNLMLLEGVYDVDSFLI